MYSAVLCRLPTMVRGSLLLKAAPRVICSTTRFFLDAKSLT